AACARSFTAAASDGARASAATAAAMASTWTSAAGAGDSASAAVSRTRGRARDTLASKAFFISSAHLCRLGSGRESFEHFVDESLDVEGALAVPVGEEDGPALARGLGELRALPNHLRQQVLGV